MAIINFNSISGVSTISVASSITVGNVAITSTTITSPTFIGNVNSTSGVTTVTTLNATTISGVSTAGITTAYVSSINDGPIAGSRNRIINGDMRIFQRGNVNVDFGGGITYVADRFGLINYWGSGTVNTSQSTTAPSGYSNSLLLTVATAAPMSGSTGYSASLMQYIEGFNVSDLYSSNVTLSFWVRSSITGTYSIQFSNATNGAFTTGDRIFVKNYTINSANTWEYKTMTISLSSGTSAGTWNKTNGNGLAVGWNLGAESNRKSNTALDTWYTALAGVYPFQSASQTNWISNSGATFYLTGVQVELGTVASAFERRNYSDELARCKRYYEVCGYCTGRTSGASSADVLWHCDVPKRATPSSTSVYLGNSGTLAQFGRSAFTITAVTNVFTISARYMGTSVTTADTGMTANTFCASIAGEATVQMSAEL